MLLCIIALIAPSQTVSTPLPPGTVVIGTVTELRAALSNTTIDDILLQPGNYKLTDSPGGELTIDNKHLNVTALEAGTVTLDAGGASRVLSITGGSEVVLSGLNITNGMASGNFPDNAVRSSAASNCAHHFPGRFLPSPRCESLKSCVRHCRAGGRHCGP